MVIGRQLTLAGVAAPTAQDGIVPTIPDELLTFLVSTGTSAENAKDVTDALRDELDITSIVQFGEWFADESLKEWFKAHVQWNKKASLYITVNWGLRTVSHIAKSKDDLQKSINEDDKIPMDPALNKSLNETWLKLYRVPLAPSQEFTSQILNRMYRELKNRTGEAKAVEGLYTRENSSSIGQEEREKKKRRRFATDFDLIDRTQPDNDDDPNFLPNRSPWVFLIALEAMLRTFSKAGCYMVKDHVTDELVPNVDRIPVEEHLVMARKFVLEWMNRRSPPKEHTVIRTLARIDLHLRQRWWKNYAENPTWTFSRAIIATESLADNQWSFDYADRLYPPAPPAPYIPPPGAWEGRGGRKGGKGGGKGGKRKKGGGKGGKGGGKGGKVTPKGGAGMGIKISTCSLNNQRVKCAKSKNNIWFCTHFNVRNNCRNDGASCEHGIHKCNIMTAATQICYGNHSASMHTGAHVRTQS